MKIYTIGSLLALLLLSACGRERADNEPVIEPPEPTQTEHKVVNTIWQGLFYYENHQGKENRVFRKHGARLMQATLRLEIDQQGRCVASIKLPVHEGGTLEPLPQRTFSYGVVGECRRTAHDSRAVFLDIDISRADSTLQGYDLLQSIAGRWQVRNVVRNYNDHLELRREGDPFVLNMQYLNLRWMGSYTRNSFNS